MASDMFLKIEGVEGESKDDTHKGEIDVLSWSWGMNQSGTMHQGTGGGAGKVSVQDIAVTKFVDQATPTLMTHVCKGDHFGEAKLTVRKAGGKPVEYLVITMTNVLITSLQTGGSGGEDRLVENIVLNFEKFEVAYKTQDEKGVEGDPISATWDISAGKP